MATSGSFKTTAYDSRYLELAWTRTSVDIPNNTSTISWTLTARGTGNWNQLNAGNFKVIIDGEQVYYSTTRITTTNGLQIATGTKTIKHNANGSKSFSASAEAAIYYSTVNCKGSGSWDLDNIPRAATITNAPNFNDEENPTITFSNPLGTGAYKLLVCISLTGAVDDIKYREITNKTATSYTFNLTDAERTVLREATRYGTNDRNVTFVLRTYTTSENWQNTSATRTFTVINAEPTIAPAVVDMNETTKALTGDMNVLIKGYSTAACGMNAVTKKGAEIHTYEISCENDYSSQSVVAFKNVMGGEFFFRITDTRGYTVYSSVTKTLIDYFKPTCNQKAEISLVGETEAKVDLSISGEFFNGSFGAVNNNVDVQIRTKTGSEEFTEWLSVSDVFWETYKSGNEYTVSGSLSGLSYNESITVQSRVIDKLETVETASYTLQLNPVFDWGKDNFNFNVPVSFQGYQMADFIIEQGTEEMGSNGMWYWTKWKSGKAECWGRRNFGIMAVNAWANGLYHSAEYTQAFPDSLFVAAPESVQITIQDCGTGALLEMGETATSELETASFRVVRPTTGNIFRSHIAFYVIGRWK